MNAVKQCAESGLTGRVALVSLGLVINDVYAIGLDAAQGMYLSEGFYWDRDDASRAFAAVVQADAEHGPGGPVLWGDALDDGSGDNRQRHGSGDGGNARNPVRGRPDPRRHRAV